MTLTKVVSLLFLFSFQADGDLFGGSPLTETSPPWDHVNHPEPPTGFFGHQSLPYPTNVWWENLVMNAGEGMAAVLPFLVKTKDTGYHVNLPGKVVNPTYIFMVFEDNIIFSANEQIGGHSIKAFDELSVTVAWDVGDGKFEVPIVRGMAYATALYEKMSPKVTIPNMITVNDKTSGQVSGSRFEIKLNNNQMWILYSDSDVTFTIDSSEKALKATGVFYGSLRAAGVWAENSIPTDKVAILDECKDAIPVGGKVSAEVTGDLAKMMFNWETIGSGDLLMLALPHHMDTVETNGKTVLEVDVLKGKMVGIRGISWTFNEPLTTITWGTTKSIPADKVGDIRSALQVDVEATRLPADDPYFGGKHMAVFARLSLIADEIGEKELAQKARDKVKPYIEGWLQGTNGDKLVYDQTWGGVVTTNGINDRNADFGNGWYNDHHFHWGYHIYTAAVIANAEPGWISSLNDNVLHMISDVADPSRASQYYPFMRTKDWYDGHAWASGIFEFGDGKNQESTSESVNGWYAIYLYGLTTGNERLKDLGRLTLALEIRAAWKYWQMTSSDSVFPAPFSDNKAVGIQWSTKVDYGTWFGGNVEYIHCIQMLPFTPITEELLRPEWVQEEYPVVAEAYNRGDLSEEWKGYIVMDHAVIDPNQAYEEALRLTKYDDGNTKSNTLYWIATRDGGEPRTTLPPDPTQKTTTTFKPTDHPDGCECDGETETDTRCLDIPNDPYGGLGCNACGVPDCRFCNFDPFPPCDA